MATIGERVKLLREARQIKPAELARRIGISQPSLWAIENGKTQTLKSTTLARLVEELRTTAGFLMGDSDLEVGDDLAPMESELMHALRSLPPDRRVSLIEYARFLMAQPGAKLAKVMKKAADVAHMPHKAAAKKRKG